MSEQTIKQRFEKRSEELKNDQFLIQSILHKALKMTCIGQGMAFKDDNLSAMQNTVPYIEAWMQDLARMSDVVAEVQKTLDRIAYVVDSYAVKGSFDFVESVVDLIHKELEHLNERLDTCDEPDTNMINASLIRIEQLKNIATAILCIDKECELITI